MKKTTLLLIMTILIGMLVLTACAASGPDTAVAAFWQALVEKDSAQVSSLSCAAYEPEALTTLESFNAVETKLEDLVCSVNSQDGDSASVSCTGSIIATYGAENMVIDLVGTLLIPPKKRAATGACAGRSRPCGACSRVRTCGRCCWRWWSRCW